MVTIKLFLNYSTLVLVIIGGSIPLGTGLASSSETNKSLLDSSAQLNNLNDIRRDSDDIFNQNLLSSSNDQEFHLSKEKMDELGLGKFEPASTSANMAQVNEAEAGSLLQVPESSKILGSGSEMLNQISKLEAIQLKPKTETKKAKLKLASSPDSMKVLATLPSIEETKAGINNGNESDEVTGLQL